MMLHRKRFKTVSLLGTGRMGTPMALRLIHAGFDVTVWNRSIGKAQALTQHGAKFQETPADAVRSAEVVITMLHDGPAVREVLIAHAVATSAAPGCLFIDMSSILPAEARAHAMLLSEHGHAALDAPVSGGTVAASAGTLAIMAGGSETTFADALPVLACMGSPTLVGPIGSGQTAKLVNQLIVAMNICAVAEGLVLAEKAGANPERVRQAISGGFAASRVLDLHGHRMTQRDFTPHAALSTQVKDLRNVLSEAQSIGAQLPVSAQVANVFTAAERHGDGMLDHSGLWRELARLNHIQSDLP